MKQLKQLQRKPEASKEAMGFPVEASALVAS